MDDKNFNEQPEPANSGYLTVDLLPQAVKEMMMLRIENAIQTEPFDVKGRFGLIQAVDRVRNTRIVTEQITLSPEDMTGIDLGKLDKGFEDALLEAHIGKFSQEEERERAMLETPSYKRAQEIKDEKLWRELAGFEVRQAIGSWLESISNPRTKRSYEMAMQELCKHGLIWECANLQYFSTRNHDVTVDRIKMDPLFSNIKGKGGTYIRRPWSEATRQQRAAAFVSFTTFLSRRTGGIIRKATPSKEGQNRTFHRISQHVKTNAFQDRREWQKFLRELGKVNHRDCLIAKIMLQGGKRISEALSMETADIDFEKGQISFRQAKTKGVAQITIITYRQEIIAELMEYIGGRTGLVFITDTGKRVAPQQIERNFEKAGKRAEIPFKVTPHVLRATTVTYFKMEGLSDSDIMKVTGHADSEMIRMYDKSALSDNASKKINLV